MRQCELICMYADNKHESQGDALWLV